MTGFGRAKREAAGVTIEVEARSVNHRHLDLRIRLPQSLSERESSLRQHVQSALSRGKVDVVVSLVAEGAGSTLEIDEEMAAGYVEASRRLQREYALEGALDVSSLMGLPGVTRLVETVADAESLYGPAGEAVATAIEALISMRATEGAALASELEGRLATIDELSARFEARAEEVVEVARQRLRKRAEQIQRDVGILDEARLHQEIVIAADRLDITEELVRLRSHVEQFRETLASAGPGAPVGRRLDFLLQELGREANTVGSKASDAPLAQDVVELKTELERIREQVQNIE
jgi:uncharacterized protein (TIGR00255 family)